MSKIDGKRRTLALANLPADVGRAVAAVLDKKALQVVVLDLRSADGFTDYFVICSGQRSRHAQGVADGVLEALKKIGTRPAHVEGYERADWVLLDYFDFIVHIFTAETRAFYALERLWGSADRVAVAEDGSEVPA